VTPVQAGGILDDIWNRREDALNQRNRPVMSSVDEGPALAQDLAWMDGRVPFRPGLLGRSGLVGQVVLVPRMPSYPAWFVASTQVTNAPDPTGAYSYRTAVVVVVRDDAASPWRIPLIVFLAFIVLRLRFPGRRHPHLGGLTGRARLVIAGSWLVLVVYLSVVFFLTAGWLT